MAVDAVEIISYLLVGREKKQCSTLLQEHFYPLFFSVLFSVANHDNRIKFSVLRLLVTDGNR